MSSALELVARVVSLPHVRPSDEVSTPIRPGGMELPLASRVNSTNA